MTLRACQMKIITFSGIDGAGKSTQIASLRACLQQERSKVACLAFWDDVVVFSRFRELISHTAFGGDRGVGTPEKPLHRRDKNVTSWPVTAARFVLYLADCLHLRMVVKRVAGTGVDVVIFDRYLHDELTNFPLDFWFARAFARLLLRIAPRPDSAFLIDAEPATARARKPEYPLEFLVRNRQSYLHLSLIGGDMTVIEPLSIKVAEARISEIVLAKVSGSDSLAVSLTHRGAPASGASALRRRT
jgi:thymidylate kinase